MRCLLLLCAFVCLASCSVQQRRYAKGFHITKNFHSTARSASGNEGLRKRNTVYEPALQFVSNDSQSQAQQSDDRLLSASAGENEFFAAKKQLATPDSCDEIFFRNGDKAFGKIEEVGSVYIKYRKCDMLEGPLYSSYKKDIALVIYVNGSQETFSAQPVPAKSAKTKKQITKEEQVRQDASLSFALGIIGLTALYYGSIHAIVVGTRALRAMKRGEASSRKKGLATAGVVMGVVKLVGLLAIIVFAIIFG
jgi:hypothetical protein